jgi:hypothetical protein
MNSSSFPPNQEITPAQPSLPPRTAGEFLADLNSHQLSAEQVQQYISETTPIVISLMRHGNLSELIYNLAINPKLLPLPHQTELIDSFADYSDRVDYLGSVSFQETHNPTAEESGVFPSLGKKWLEILRSHALINFAHGNQERFLQTAKAELLLSILVCQVHADDSLSKELVDLLPEKQFQELEEVIVIHDLIKNVRQNRVIEQVIPPEKELLLNYFIKNQASFDLIFESIFNLHLLPQQKI